MKHKNNDPRRMALRFACSCPDCGKTLKKGDSAFYFPLGTDKIKCLKCGQSDFNEFALSVQDENSYNNV